MPDFKVCARCAAEKPVAEFDRNAQSKDGYRPRCKVCRKADRRAAAEADPEGVRQYRRDQMRAWRAANPDAALAASRRAYAANPESARMRSREWQQRNPGKVLAAKRAYRERNPEKRAEYEAARRANDAGRVRELERANYLRNRVAIVDKVNRRRARLRDASVGPVDLDALWDQQEGICALCAEPIDRSLRWPHPLSASVDHIRPLSKGGTHEQSNLQWTHLVENIRKGATVLPDSALIEGASHAS